MAATAPARLLDTRVLGLRPAAATPVVVDTGAAAEASAVFVNLTVTEAAVPTYATAWPADDDGSCTARDVPPTSNVNVPDASAHANAGVVGIGGQGRICVQATAPAHLVVDRLGLVTPGVTELGPMARRLLDTRSAGGPVAAGGVVAVPTSAAPGDDVLVTLTVTEVGADGYLALVPPAPGGGCPTTATATTSVVNVSRGHTRANLALATAGDGGQVCVLTHGPAHMVVDLVAA